VVLILNAGADDLIRVGDANSDEFGRARHGDVLHVGLSSAQRVRPRHSAGANRRTSSILSASASLSVVFFLRSFPQRLNSS
jgi:hypothetical protein